MHLCNAKLATMTWDVIRSSRAIGCGRRTQISPPLVLSLLLQGLVLACSSPAAASDEPARIRILFVGNSYTYVNDLPRILQVMAIQSGRRSLPEVRIMVGPGFAWEDHWKVEAAQKVIKSTQWDYVVLQEQSQEPILHEQKMKKFGTLLIDAVHRSHASPLLFVTWSRENEAAAQSVISTSYARLASAARAQMVPVDKAWQYMRERHPEFGLYRQDGSHPSPAGSYLAACVFYRTIYWELPRQEAATSFLTFQSKESGYAERVVPVPLNSEQVAAVQDACGRAFVSAGTGGSMGPTTGPSH
jgi:hypothetical protein